MARRSGGAPAPGNRRPRKRLLGIEPLEGRTLLSDPGLPGLGARGVQPPLALIQNGAVNRENRLRGSLDGVFRAQFQHGGGSSAELTYTLLGRAHLKLTGLVRVRGQLRSATTATGASGELTLSNHRGTLTLDLAPSDKLAGKKPELDRREFIMAWTIRQGTGHYEGITGTGLFDASFPVTSGPRAGAADLALSGAVRRG